MALDSGTRRKISPHGYMVNEQKSYDMNIALGDKSQIYAAVQGVRPVKWKRNDRLVTWNLPKSPVVPDVGIRLLSTPALNQEGFGVLLDPRKAVISNIKDRCTVIGYAEKSSDGLDYISDDQAFVPAELSDQEETVRAMIDLAQGSD